MNKLAIMRQPSVQTLLEEMIKFQPGITTTRLWETTREWAGKIASRASVQEFERELEILRIAKDYRCTNKQWYPAGHVAPPKLCSGPKGDPRQLRMFG